MTYKASASKERFEEIKKNPLLFCKHSEETLFNMGRPFTKVGWFSCDSTISFFVEKESLALNDESRLLFFIGKQIQKSGNVEKKKEKDDSVFFELEMFDVSNSDHWKLIFNDCYYNSKAGNHRHGSMSLVWAIYTKSWNVDVLNKAFLQCSREMQQIVANSINNTLYLFSLDKQSALISIIKNIIPNLVPRVIPDVEKVLKELSPNETFNQYGFYSKIDYIISFGNDDEQKKKLTQLYSTSRNTFIHYKYWKDNCGHKLFNYSVLLDVFSYASLDEQMQIIKRYLHDVRLNVTVFDDNIIKGFRDYKYPSCVDGRYFITSPGSNMLMTAPMFSDAVLTLKNTKGERLQTFNGILDLAIKHSNRAYPNIDFGIHRFLPYCDGGLIPNKSFYGFIHFDVHYSLEESLLSEENLKDTANYILRYYASRQSHGYCTHDNDRTLSELEMTKCSMLFRRKNKAGATWENDCDCLKFKYYNPDRWKRIDFEKDKILSLCIENLNRIEGMFTYDVISLPLLKSNILKWAEYYKDIVFYNDHLPSDFEKNDFAKHVIQKFYKPTKIDIFPNKSMFYSSKKSLLNLWNEEEIPEKSRDEFAQSHESAYIFNKTFESLKSMCPDAPVYDDHITISYDYGLLNSITTFFYYRNHPYNPADGYSKCYFNNLKFLIPKKVNNIRYCTPKISDEKDKVSDLPFFWCGSEECFCNVLEKQTLQKQEDWRMYSLYHAAEIIGHKLIIETPEGNIASNVINNFAAELRQAERLYSRLICRTCGHMIFSTRGSMLNGSRFFNCLNAQCDQYKKEVYLSQCNTCKSGLIDSRDSKKCPNNWVICPHCLSCCNDGLFDSLYQKHLRNVGDPKFIPSTIKNNVGKGHNNKYQFFCYNCGEPLGYTTIKEEVNENGQMVEKEKKVRGCDRCKISLEEQLMSYSNSTNSQNDPRKVPQIIMLRKK